MSSVSHCVLVEVVFSELVGSVVVFIVVELLNCPVFSLDCDIELEAEDVEIGGGGGGNDCKEVGESGGFIFRGETADCDVDDFV